MEAVPGCRITVIAIWQPWIAFTMRDKIAAMRRELEAKGARLESRPFALLPSRRLLYDHRTLPLLTGFVKLAFRFLGLGRFRLVHARAYMAGMAAAALKERYNYRLIFDMRSLFPEENVTAGKWALGSPVYRAWKAHEREAVERSDAHIAVSAPMKEDADRIAPPKRAALIPLNADLSRLRFDPVAREKRRAEEDWAGCFVIAYVGGLGAGNSWNDVRNYASYFRSLDPLIPGLRMVFLVPEIQAAFGKAFEEAGAAPERIRFVRGADDISAWLSAADAGIQVMSPGPDSRTRFGVKVVEYLACGLPVISNTGAGAAADFLEEHKAGIRLDPGPDFEAKAKAFPGAGYRREELARLAADHFSLPVIAERYGAVYRSLLGMAAQAERFPAEAAAR
jgi:glycosyltransferase involved in cell wall biosynthesis